MPTIVRGVKMPTFPSTWYHPIYGGRTIENYDDFIALDDDWRMTAAEADKDRTDTEARVVMNHNDQLKREEYMEAARKAGPQVGAKDAPADDADMIVRNSVQADVAQKAIEANIEAQAARQTRPAPAAQARPQAPPAGQQGQAATQAPRPPPPQQQAPHPQAQPPQQPPRPAAPMPPQGPPQPR